MNYFVKSNQLLSKFSAFFASNKENTAVGRNVTHPFWVIVQKEITDHVRSWRFIILIIIISLTCMGSLYTALSNMTKAVKADDPEGAFLFLRIFTISDGTLPSFFVFVSFLGPLLGIAMGFDAVNSEQSKGTLSRILSQPVHRDYLLNAKLIAALTVIGIMLFVLGYLVMGIGIIAIGIPPTVGEFLRINFYILLSIIYVAFWLNLSILFSVRFRNSATSALSGISVWLFFTVFYPMIISLVTKPFTPNDFSPPHVIYLYEKLKFLMVQIMPNELYSEATTTMLMPSVRSLGPLTMEQVAGAIPGPLPIGQSLLLVWPQVTGLIAATVLCFAISYRSFMRKEIRSR
jgi:ABC-2 type transport system permease protein